MEEFNSNDVVRYRERPYTVEIADIRSVNHEVVEATYSIVPLNVSHKADRDNSQEALEEYLNSMIHGVPGNELTLISRASE